ncbi:MAG: LytR C-terminal domain-containing protein [Actinomycetales bacterium]|nr:LytR C-terminal domain-containing protein [Actinomycetales bacterium]
MNARPWTPESRDALLTRVTALTAGTAVAGAVGALGLGAALAATTHAKSVARTTTSSSAAAATGSSSTGSAAASTVTPRVVAPRQVKVQVLNGIGVAGAARSVADKLSSAGFDVVAIGNAPGGQVSASTIVYAPTEIAAARTLAAATGVGTGSPTGTGSVVTLVIGPDWTGALPAAASSSGGTAPVPVQAPQYASGPVVATSGGS